MLFQQEQFVEMDLLRGLFLDSFRTSHPISVPVASPDEINDIFDRISYSKVKWCCYILAG